MGGCVTALALKRGTPPLMLDADMFAITFAKLLDAACVASRSRLLRDFCAVRRGEPLSCPVAYESMDRDRAP